MIDSYKREEKEIGLLVQNKRKVFGILLNYDFTMKVYKPHKKKYIKPHNLNVAFTEKKNGFCPHL